MLCVVRCCCCCSVWHGGGARASSAVRMAVVVVALLCLPGVICHPYPQDRAPPLLSCQCWWWCCGGAGGGVRKSCLLHASAGQHYFVLLAPRTITKSRSLDEMIDNIPGTRYNRNSILPPPSPQPPPPC